jgi:hypothetical protein
MQAPAPASTIKSTLAPTLEAFEAKRIKCLNRFYVTTAILSALMVLSWVWITASAPQDIMLLLWPLLIGLGATGMAFYIITQSYRSSFKTSIIKPVVESFLPDIGYYPKQRIDRDLYQRSQLFLKGVDRYRGEDYIIGIKGKTEFEFSELHTEYITVTRTKNGRSTSRHTIFKGIFFVADFHKDFNGRTFVLPDTIEGLLGKFGQTLQKANFSRPDLVKLEDPEFEKAFCVYADDQVEARYILSPSLMRRILNYKEKFGNKIYLSFIQSKLYIALSSNKNHFEPKVFSSVTNPGLIDEYLADLELFVGIVDDLNLNLRIWSKV